MKFVIENQNETGDNAGFSGNVAAEESASDSNQEQRNMEEKKEFLSEDNISDEEKDMTASEEQLSATASQEPIIELKGIDVYQKDILILSDVSLSIKKGEMVYLVGKTGSGKSGLLKILYGDIPVRKGSAHIAGYDLSQIKTKNIQRLRRKLGIVFQDFQLLYDRNVYENLKFVTKVTGWKDRYKRDERIEEVLTMVGLQTKGHKMPHQLSGGEQQRVSIARALVNNPEIILADEPTGNLDPETSYDIFKLFKSISEKGTSVLIATHDYLIVHRIPSRVLQITDGKVTE